MAAPVVIGGQGVFVGLFRLVDQQQLKRTIAADQRKGAFFGALVVAVDDMGGAEEIVASLPVMRAADRYRARQHVDFLEGVVEMRHAAAVPALWNLDECGDVAARIVTAEHLAAQAVGAKRLPVEFVGADAR